MADAIFPNGIKSWIDKLDTIDDVKAQDINEAYAEIIAVENELRKPSYSLPTLRTAPFTIPADAIDAGFGQMEVRGRSLRQELMYNRETWAEWAFASATGDATGISLNCVSSSGIAPYARLNTKAKVSTKYGILLNIPSNAMTGTTFYLQMADISTTAFGASETGDKKYILTIGGTITNNRITIGANNANGNGVIKIKDIRVFELPAGSQIESDFNTLTADQLAVKYPYIPGDRVYHALQDGARLVSTNGNIWGGEKAADDIVQTVNNPAYAYKVTLDGRNCLVAIGHTAIQNKTFFDKFEQVTQYTIQAYMKNNGTSGGLFIISYTDGTFSTLAGSGVTTSWQLKTLTTTAGKTVKNITLSGQYGGAITYYDIDTLQIEKGTVATAYVPYDPSRVYIPPSTGLKSLPNGVCDVLDLVTGRKTQNVSEDCKFAGSNNWLSSGLTYDNVYRFYLNSSGINVADILNRESGAYQDFRLAINGNYSINRYSNTTGADSGTGNHEHWLVDASSTLIVFVNKAVIDPLAGATPLDKFKAWAATISLNYQLATPVYHDNACSGSLTAHPGGMVYIDYGRNLFNGNTLGGVMHIPDDRPAVSYVESVMLINLETGERTPTAFTQPAAGAREFVIGQDGYYEVVYHGVTYSTNPDIYESHAVNRAAQSDQLAKDVELLNEQMADVENLTRKTASEILEERDSIWHEFTGPVASLPVDAGGMPEVEVLANAVNQMANNGVNYANWTVAGAGTTKGANGIHLVQNGGTDLASLPIPGIKGNTQYTLVYRVLNSNANSGFVLANNAPSFLDTTFVLPKTPGVQKVLITTKANVSADNAIKFVLDSANTEGTYIDITDIMLFEGDQTKNLGIDQYIQYGLQSSSDIRLTAKNRNFANPDSFEQGGLTGVGTENAATTRVKTSKVLAWVVEAGQTYTPSIGNSLVDGKTIAPINIAYLDANKQDISISTMTTPIAFVAASGVKYIRMTFRFADDTNITPEQVKRANIQLEKGTVATAYTPYRSTSALIPGEYSAVGSVRDAVRYAAEKGWEGDDRCKVKVLETGDITLLTTTNTNFDRVAVNRAALADIYAQTSGVTPDKIIIPGFTKYPNVSLIDDAQYVNTFYDTTSIGASVIVLLVAKGAYANLAAAQAGLTGKKVLYQLAATVTTPLTGIPTLDLEPGGMLLVESGVIEFRAHPDGGVIPIPDATKPIISIDKVLKPVVEDGILHYEAITPSSNTATTITLPAGYSDATEYKVVYKTTPTPLPTVRYRYGVNLAAKVEATEGLAVQLSKQLSDFMAYQNVQNIMFDARLTALET